LVQDALRAPEVAFVLVTSPAPMSIQEVLFFSDRLAEHRMPRGAFVVNRFRLPPPRATEGVTVAEAKEALGKSGLALEDDGPERLVRAHQDQVRLAQLDALHVRALAGKAKSGAVPIVRVPELASDVHDVRLLAEVGELLTKGGV
jgi:hypothetical protein